MKKFCCLLILALVLPLAAADYPAPPPPDNYIVDKAGVLSSSDLDRINALCREVERVTTAEMAVLVIRTTDNEDISMYATNVGNRWGVGQKSKDNGLVMVVAIDDRKVFTATGSGMEGYLTDARINQVYRGVIVPNFRNSDYGKGIYEALQLYSKDIEKEYGVTLEGAKDAPQISENTSSSKGGGLGCFPICLFILFPGLFFLFGILRSIMKGGRGGGFWTSGGSSGGGFSSGGGGFSGGGFGGGGFSGGGGGGGW